MISVIITCYNESEFIGSAIESVLNQTAIDQIDEIIVVDDGSSDNSLSIIKSIASKCNKIQIISQLNSGLPTARNNGIACSKREYIALLDGDDLWLENKIEKQLEIINKYPEVGLIYTDFFTCDPFKISNRQRIRAKSYRYGEQNLAEFFVYDAPMIPSTVILRKTAFLEAGGFDPEFKMGQDTDLWLRIGVNHYYHHLPEALIYKRVRSGSLGQDIVNKYRFYEIATSKMIKLRPDLTKFVGKRRAFRLTKLGQHYQSIGELKQSRESYFSSVILDPFNIKTYYYLICTYLPNKLTQRLTDLLKDFKHRRL